MWLTGCARVGITNQFTVSGTPTSAGPYTFKLRIWDAGPSIVITSDVYTINIYDNPSITLDGKTDITCFGADDGSISISVSGGTTPYTFSWTGPSSYTNEDISNLAPGTYDVVVTDSKNCQDDLTGTIIQEPGELDANVTHEDPDCYDVSNGHIDITGPSGGSGNYGYSIDGGANWQSSGTFSNLHAGTYNVQIRDAAHITCVKPLINPLDLTEPPELTATVNFTNATCGNNGTITISAAAGGTDGYQYSIGGTWQSSGIFTGLAPGNYTARIRDASVSTCVKTLSPDPVVIADQTLPIDLMLVLDLSGSMLSPMPAGAPLSKLEVLERDTKVFLNAWQDFIIDPDPAAGHRIGLSYFKTDIDCYGGWPSCALKTDTIGLHQYLVSQTTTWTDLTAMGGGLQNAINCLDDPNKNRQILLFTDGMQNVNPLVDPGTLDIKYGSASDDSNIPESTPDPTNLNDIGQKIYAVGVGISDITYQDLLQDITLNDANAYFEIDATEELDDDLTTLITSITSCNSPKVIDYRKGTLAGGNADEVFKVSGNAEKVLFKVCSHECNVDFKLFRGGAEIPSSAGIVSHGGYYKLFTLQFPLVVGGQVVNPGGDWKLEISGQSGAGYRAAALEDESSLNFQTAMVSIDHRIGDTLKLKASLDLLGQVITAGCEVRAIILKPGEDLGDLLATTKIPGDNFQLNKKKEWPPYIILPPGQSSFEKGMSPGHRKYQVLMSDPVLFARMKGKENIINLEKQADGSYSGFYTNTDVSGPYRVVFQATGFAPGIGDINRVESKSTIVQYGVVLRSASDLYVMPAAGTNTPARLSVRPRDYSGKFIGPDCDASVMVSTSEGSVRNRINKLDGRYTADLVYPSGNDPTVTVTVFEDTIYNGKVSGLYEKFSVGLTGAYTLPISNFANTHSGSVGGIVDFEWMFSRMFSLDVQAGLWTFSPSYSIAGGTALLHYAPPVAAAGFIPYVGAGAGIYKPENIDLSTGIAGKVGFKRRLGGPGSINKCLSIDLNHVWLDINATYYYLNVPNDNRDFLGVGIGLRYSF